MLPLMHQQRYERFQEALEQLRLAAVQPNSDSVSLESDVAELQLLFQDQILGLSIADLPLDVEQRVQSYQVEMNKQLRLLGMDVMFLRAARQAVTREQRRNQMNDRIGILIRYCEALLGTGKE